jgi:hypothetical protein
MGAELTIAHRFRRSVEPGLATEWNVGATKAGRDEVGTLPRASTSGVRQEPLEPKGLQQGPTLRDPCGSWRCKGAEAQKHVGGNGQLSCPSAPCRATPRLDGMGPRESELVAATAASGGASKT